MTKPLPPTAPRARRAPSPTLDAPAQRAWTLDPERLAATCALLYTLGGQETCVEVIAWREGDPWPDAEADEGWTRLLGEGVDPRNVRIGVPTDCRAMIRRRGRTGGPDSAWTTVQAFRATPGAVALWKDPFGVWLSIDGVVRGARIQRPEPDADGRHPVTGEVMRFARTNGVDALAPCPTLLELTLTNDAYLTALHFLRDFPALRTLDLTDCSYVSWMQPLADLPDLESLRLRWCDEGGVPHDALGTLERLRVLDVSFTNARTLDLLWGLRHLEHLDVEGNARLTDIEGLYSVNRLRTLDLSGCTRIRSLEPLAHHPTLETLRLRENHDDLDLSALATIPTLRVLDLRDCHARRGRRSLLRRKNLTVLTTRRPRRRPGEPSPMECDSQSDFDDRGDYDF
jgi:hypothetical protein